METERRLASYSSTIIVTEDALSTYNSQLAVVDELLIKFQAKQKTVSAFTIEMLMGVKAVYGRDSDEYEKTGGTRLSERKKPGRGNN